MTRRHFKNSDLVFLLRKRLDYHTSQTKLAEEIGVTKQAISRMLAGKLPVSAKAGAMLGLERGIIWTRKEPTKD